jgi:DNA-binding transcriptional LysR family regulator
MELYQLRTFKMVAEEGHLTRAAKRMHASQPSISAHIKALEEELGISLFQRTPKGMILTAEGIKLKQHADTALAVVDEMVSQAGKLRETLNGELRIGINTGADSLRIPELFKLMKARHPNLNMHLLQCMTGEVLNKLENGGLDAGFMYGENSSEKIFAVELKNHEVVIAGPIAWHERLMAAQPAELDQFPWIMTPADCPFDNLASQLFKTYGILPARVVLIDQETTIMSMIKAGTGISLLLEQDVRQDELEGNLAIWRKEELSLNLSIACLKRRKDEPVLQKFFSVLSEVWAD